MINEVTIQVPATSANLGPGYDCLGVALQIYNRITVRRKGEGRATKGESGMADDAASAFFEAARVEPFDFDWNIEGDVPRSRGLGSSVTVRLGILHGVNELCGRPLSDADIFKICARLEGHPDNAAPAAFGGFTVAGSDGSFVRFDVSDSLKFVLLIPDFEVSTPEARKVLPDMLPRGDAVLSCANACRITAAFAGQRYDLLADAFADGLHQPYRERLIPFFPEAITAGKKAGALGGFLSGSGSTVCCVTLDTAEQVGEAMLAASNSPGARIVITTADNEGARTI